MADYILKHSGLEIDSAVDKIKNLDNVFKEGENAKKNKKNRIRY